MNIYRIFLSNINSALSKRFNNKNEISGNLKELLVDETIEEIVEKIIEYICSIPRSYSIHFPMPALLGFGENVISLSENISIAEYFDKDKIPGGHQETSLLGISFGGKGLEVGVSYIRIIQSGYAGGSLNDSAFIAALSKFKQIVHLGLLCDVFSKKKTGLLSLGLFERLQYNLGINAVVYDNANPDNVACIINLPRNIASYIEKIEINGSNERYLAAKERGNGAINEYFKNTLKFPVRLINTPEENKGALPIKTAIEWAFDSEINENDTISFLQMCIGLEAILGDELDPKEQPLSKTLADRCAYLIGKNIQGRKRIKERFKKLYDLRSKLVHGRTVRLHDNEKDYLNWGKKILNRVILKEIKNLKPDEN